MGLFGAGKASGCMRYLPNKGSFNPPEQNHWSHALDWELMKEERKRSITHYLMGQNDSGLWIY